MFSKTEQNFKEFKRYFCKKTYDLVRTLDSVVGYVDGLWSDDDYPLLARYRLTSSWSSKLLDSWWSSCSIQLSDSSTKLRRCLRRKKYSWAEHRIKNWYDVNIPKEKEMWPGGGIQVWLSNLILRHINKKDFPFFWAVSCAFAINFSQKFNMGIKKRRILKKFWKNAPKFVKLVLLITFFCAFLNKFFNGFEINVKFCVFYIFFDKKFGHISTFWKLWT